MAGYARSIALAVMVISSALIVSIFAVPTLTSAPAANDSSEADTRRIVAVINGRGSDPPDFKHVKLSDNTVQINSMQWTLDPFGRSMRTFYEAGINRSATAEEKKAWAEDADAQERYMLVRLPAWLGGAENDISAYRAFSAFDIASHCTIRYWGGDRMLIQDPCHSNGYRPWDGLTVYGVSSFGGSGGAGTLFSPVILALPQMRLGVDSEGYIVGYKPDNTLYSDGAVGDGKRFTPEQMEESNEKMIQAASKHAGFELPFPAGVFGAHLVWMVPGEELSFNLFNLGRSFEGYEGAFSAVYQPRPLSNSYSSYRITVFLNETLTDESQAKTTFDHLLGTASPECDQGCKFVIKQSDGMMARVNTEAEADALNAQALAWGRAGDQDIMVAIEGINSNMEELVQIATSLDIS